MDVISNAIKNKWHKCGNTRIEKQTWQAFGEEITGKEIFLFGTAGGLEYFIRNYGKNVDIAGVIDNDKSKQNHKLGLLCGDAWNTKYEEMIVQKPEMLEGYCRQNIVVLITSMKNYISIIEQLKQMGIETCYVLLVMEANKRQSFLKNEGECFEEIRSEYIEQCCRKEIKNNKIVMLVSLYGGHARQITGALIKEKIDLDIVWIVNDLGAEKPDEVRIVYEKNWKKYIYEMETAKIWVFDDPVPYFFQKRDEQIYIQVKHWSSITFKKFYLDDKAFCKVTKEKEKIELDGERMDYVFTGSEFDEDSCKRGLRFRGKAIRVGSARSDILFDKGVREKVLAKFGLGKKTKICLYVPTYRQKEFDEKGSISISLDMKALLNVLEDKWGGTWYLFVRLHPCLGFTATIAGNEENIINVGSYSNSEELVAASDIMIADYSSITFEGAYKKEPIFLYAPDRKEYIDGERDLLIDYDKLPFPIAESNEELFQCITDFDIKEYEKKVVEFLYNYGIHEDGHASERAARFIRGLLEDKI